MYICLERESNTHEGRDNVLCRLKTPSLSVNRITSRNLNSSCMHHGQTFKCYSPKRIEQYVRAKITSKSLEAASLRRLREFGVLYSLPYMFFDYDVHVLHAADSKF